MSRHVPSWAIRLRRQPRLRVVVLHFTPRTPMTQLGPGGLLGQPSDDITRGCCRPCGWSKELSRAAPSCPSPTTAKACHSAALYKSTLGLSCNFFNRTYTAPSGTGARLIYYRKRSCGATGLQFGAPSFSVSCKYVGLRPEWASHSRRMLHEVHNRHLPITIFCTYHIGSSCWAPLHLFLAPGLPVFPSPSTLSSRPAGQDDDQTATPCVDTELPPAPRRACMGIGCLRQPPALPASRDGRSRRKAPGMSRQLLQLRRPRRLLQQHLLPTRSTLRPRRQ